MDTVEHLHPPGLAVPNGHVRQSVWPRLLEDLPYAAMLLLALTGVVLRLPVTYWVVLTPVFSVISIAEGWGHSRTARSASAWYAGWRSIGAPSCSRSTCSSTAALRG